MRKNSQVQHDDAKTNESIQIQSICCHRFDFVGKLFGIILFIAAYIFFLLYISLSLDSFTYENKVFYITAVCQVLF